MNIHILQVILVTKNTCHKIDSNTMWKTINLAYRVVYLNSPFVKDTLKDQWWDVLKDLKFGNFNEGIVKVVPQFNGVLHNSKQWMVMP